MTYKTILFDVDNTLIDSASIAATVFHDVIATYGINIPVQQLRDLVGLPTDKILKQLQIEPVAEIAANYVKAISAYKDDLQFFDGIRDTWEHLNNNGINTGIVTSRTMPEVKSDLANFPEITNSKIIVTADKTSEHKPSGAPLEFAIKQNNLVKNETIYVGDTIYDMQAAFDAKIDFASASWGALPSVDFSEATYQLKQPYELLSL
ncbi:hypothetical protein C5Z25_06565 [Lactobacillus sp. CBA3605]|uniref:HAD family hydrolase n=1 Tax=Lactobacillus sp. CBA3605 TaxID=2099788 RepID=UPI000CFBA216|nr:HAD-IA family hydrolase [Lactobacillus sp. CBA3605]AVK61453.1 hypothetical protein C5Z25_06565 [Lactobacillus sp. CBA3605]